MRLICPDKANRGARARQWFQLSAPIAESQFMLQRDILPGNISDCEFVLMRADIIMTLRQYFHPLTNAVAAGFMFESPGMQATADTI